jgi:hypothetical protein
MQRLIAALDAAREVSRQIGALLQGAEQEAAAIFQGGGGDAGGMWDGEGIQSSQGTPPSEPSLGATALSVVLDFIPVVGELKGLAEVVTGHDLVTGEDLGAWRWAGLLGLVGLNEAKLLRHGDNALTLARHADDAMAVAEKEGRLFSKLTPGGGLLAHEARGGHLIARHVGKSDAELVARLAAQPGIKGASSFADRATAEAVTSSALRDNQATIRNWLESSTSPTLKLTYNGDPATPIGRGIMRGAKDVQPMHNAEIILKRDASSGGFILTGYPRP